MNNDRPKTYAEYRRMLALEMETKYHGLKSLEPAIKLLNQMAKEWQDRGGRVSVAGLPVNDYTFFANEKLTIKDFNLLLDSYFGDTEFITESVDGELYLWHVISINDSYPLKVYANKTTFKGCIVIETDEFVEAEPAKVRKRVKYLCSEVA